MDAGFFLMSGAPEFPDLVQVLRVFFLKNEMPEHSGEEFEKRGVGEI
jgi:hypothetical protein